MGYQPIFDGEFDDSALDLDNPKHFRKLLGSLQQHKLVLLKFDQNGTCGPVVHIRGTRRQIVGWLRTYYCPEHADPEAAFVEFGASDVIKQIA
jgi:hypothetical protein